MNVKKFTWYIIIYLVLWAVSVFIPDILFGNATSITAKMMIVQVPVAEYGIFTINLHLSTFFEFVLPFIINTAFTFLFYREIKITKPIFEENKWNVWTKYAIILSMFIFSLGSGFHYVGDALDTIIPFDWIKIFLLTGNYDNAIILFYMKIPAYLMDEVISHKLEYIGILGSYMGLALIQYWHPIEIEPEKVDFYGLGILGGAYGIAMAIAFAEGQAAFEFLFVVLGILIFILIQVKRLDINLKKVPFLTFFLCFLIAMAISIPVWGIATGFKSYYPFFFQMSEL